MLGGNNYLTFHLRASIVIGFLSPAVIFIDCELQFIITFNIMIFTLVSFATARCQLNYQYFPYCYYLYCEEHTGGMEFKALNHLIHLLEITWLSILSYIYSIYLTSVLKYH